MVQKNNKNILLSVIIAMYNDQTYIADCIESVLAQDIPNMEIIIVNDGSTDNSGKIVAKYAEKNSNIIVLNKENGGLVSARKYGIKIAKGLYATYIDSDDTLEKGAYKEALEAAIMNNADVVIYDYNILKSYGEKIHQTQEFNGGKYAGEEKKSKIDKSMFMTDSSLNFGFVPAVWNKIYKTEILKKRQLEVDDRITIGEDVACSYACILDASSIIYLKHRYLYNYRENNNSMTRKWNDSKIKSCAILMEYLIHTYGNNFQNDLKNYYVYILTNMLYEYRCNRLFVSKKNIFQEYEPLMSCSLFQMITADERFIPQETYRRIGLWYLQNKGIGIDIIFFLYILNRRIILLLMMLKDTYRGRIYSLNTRKNRST